FEANQVQNASVISGIKMFMSIFPAVGTLLSVVFIYFYPLTENKLKEITAELEIRRNKSTDERI
ncbi:MAG TPA: MFS transporter, partial [Porphyromonadaceae bacterium]|nr:MFS transporter [Porphyromonadaceae bacterium]